MWRTARQDYFFEYKYFVYNGVETEGADAYEWLGKSDKYKHQIVNRCLNLSRKCYFITNKSCSLTFRYFPEYSFSKKQWLLIYFVQIEGVCLQFLGPMASL